MYIVQKQLGNLKAALKPGNRENYREFIVG